MLEISHVFLEKEGEKILEDVSFSVKPGEMLAIVGKSGAGKSSLIHLLTAEEKPTSGGIFLDNQPIHALSGRNKRLFRQQIGIIYQDYRLLPQKTVEENVLFPLLAQGYTKNIITKAETALHAVGMLEKRKNFPKTLSGGEKQRAAIARALVHDPKILFADEPTGNLDPTATKDVADIFQMLHDDFGLTIVFSTHDPAFLRALSPRVLHFLEGKLVQDAFFDDWDGWK